MLVRTIEGWQGEFQAALGTRFVWAADELYLSAGIALPPAAAYEGFAVAEDGIGLVRRFEDAWARALGRRRARRPRPRRVTVVTGELFAPRMRALLDRLRGPGPDGGPRADPQRVLRPRHRGGRAAHRAGSSSSSSGEAACGGRGLGDEVLVPAVALRDGAGVFLDDLTPADLAASLGTPVIAVEPTAPALLAALLGR